VSIKIADRRTWRISTTEVIASTDSKDEYCYVSLTMRVKTRLVNAFAYRDRKPVRNVAVVTVYENDHEYRYWVDARIRTVAGLKRLAMQVLRHHDQEAAKP